MKHSTYPVTPPTAPSQIDVVVPYSSNELHLVAQAINGILAQQHCIPIIHAVADNCKSIRHPDCINYEAEGVGPYNITNALVPHLRSQYLAIHDADDVSLSARLWKQIEQLKLGYVMTSCAMLQVPIEGYSGGRHIAEPIIEPGLIQAVAPKGRCINSTRTITVEFFVDQNGFADMPCSGDYQFDNRCLLQLPPQPIHSSPEIFGLRHLRPTSLSNAPNTGAGSEVRNVASWQVVKTIQAMRANPTKEQSRQLGKLHESGNVALSLID